jgi:hypothetical protein
MLSKLLEHKRLVSIQMDFIFEQRTETESLIHAINVGVYMENKTYVDVLNSYNHIRSDFIEVEHFQYINHQQF